MPRPDPNYRADSHRAIHILAPLTEDLLAGISPKVLELRANPAEPITVFINSPGGSIRILDILDGLLRSRDADGRTNRIVTVALGDANSAAATLLALGDYAIAYPHSRMHFHGSRLMVEELTAEKASDRAGLLAELNRSIALRLARVVLRRLVLRSVQLQSESSSTRQHLKDASPIDCFVECLKCRVSFAGDRLLDKAREHMRRLERVSKSLSKVKWRDSDSRLVGDKKVFQAILDFEIRERGKGDWSLDERGVQDVVADYFLLRDYIFGEHTRHLDGIIAQFGPSFLSEEQFPKFTEMQSKSSDDARKWLLPLVQEEVRDFWHFTVCLCRLMQEGENPLVATDAYWLGVLDEILGTDYHGARNLMEADVAPVNPDRRSGSDGHP